MLSNRLNSASHSLSAWQSWPLDEQLVATSLPPSAAIVRHCPGQCSKLLTIGVHGDVQHPESETWDVHLEERLDLRQERR